MFEKGDVVKLDWFTKTHIGLNVAQRGTGAIGTNNFYKVESDETLTVVSFTDKDVFFLGLTRTGIVIEVANEKFEKV